MSETEKVINDLNVSKLMLCNPQVLTPEMCVKIGQAINTAIDLLKEQEPKSVESIQMDRSDTWGADLSGYCPSCKRPLKNRFNKQFCGECGQAVKWE